MLSRKNSTSFLINNMLLTYNYQKGCSAPTHFIVNTGFTVSLYRTIYFDQLIKAYIPTPRCLHQSIYGTWSLHILLAPFGLTKPSGCIIYISFLINPLRNAVFDFHLPDFVNVAIANMIRTDLSIDTSEKISS